MILTMTTDKSLVNVSYDGTILTVSFDFNKELFNLMRQVPNANYNETVAYKWVVPKPNYPDLIRIMGTNITWKTKEQMAKDTQELAFVEETLEDVLSRIPKNIDTSFMKVEPYNFQKLSTAWGITKKGKKGQIYGGLLADLMGLGKTIQAITFASYLKRHQLPDKPPVKKVLIICPSTLKVQWGQEIERFTDEKFIIINGGNGKNAFEKRIEQYESVRNDDTLFTIMNYELLFQKHRLGKKEVKKGKSTSNKVIFGDFIDLNEIKKTGYDMIILDEAQRVKNPKSEAYQALQHIQSPFVRLLMSGTPIEKDLQNIFPLFDYLSPNIFADERLPFKERMKIFEDKFLVMGLNTFALQKSRGRTKIMEVKGVKNLPLLNSTIKPYMLRRKTEDVSGDMPQATISDIPLDMSDIQNKLFVLFTNKRKELHELLGIEIAKENKNTDAILKLENEIKQIHGCLVQLFCTPELLVYSQSALVKSILSKVKPIQTYLEKFSKISKIYNVKGKEEILNSLNMDIESKSATDALFGINKELSKIKPDFFTPAKLDFFLEKAEDLVVGNNEKIVVFSRYVSMNKILYRELFKRLNLDSKGKLKKDTTNIVYYNGETDLSCKWSSQLKKENKLPENKEVLNCMKCPFMNQCNSRTKSAYLFQNDPNTKIIICSDAAKEGVNLQSGRYLFNYDLPESSSVYKQRIGRIERLGSKHNNVYIYNLLTIGGTDEKLRRDINKQLRQNKVAIEYSEKEKSSITGITDNF